MENLSVIYSFRNSFTEDISVIWWTRWLNGETPITIPLFQIVFYWSVILNFTLFFIKIMSK